MTSRKASPSSNAREAERGTMNGEAESIPLSALQHWLFCPRQCGLIHVERIWRENLFTAQGRVLHASTDKKGHEQRKGVRVLKAVELFSARLGVHGVADVVELHGHPPRPVPVEYKRGRPKAHRADEVQLCAQAICLEEMMQVEIPRGFLFYGQTRRRKEVRFDTELRELTARVAAEVHELMRSGRVPPPAYDKARCGPCSLLSVCRPRRMARPPSVSRWLERAITGSGAPGT